MNCARCNNPALVLFPDGYCGKCNAILSAPVAYHPRRSKPRRKYAHKKLCTECETRLRHLEHPRCKRCMEEDDRLNGTVHKSLQDSTREPIIPKVRDEDLMPCKQCKQTIQPRLNEYRCRYANRTYCSERCYLEAMRERGEMLKRKTAEGATC